MCGGATYTSIWGLVKGNTQRVGFFERASCVLSWRARQLKEVGRVACGFYHAGMVPKKRMEVSQG